MTDDAQTTPAGFYPDPAGGPARRWWDGRSWTDTFETPGAGVGADGRPIQPALPADTNVNTPFIWVLSLLPLLGIVQLLIMDFGSIMRASIEDPTNPAAIYTPGYVVALLLSFLTYAASVLLAYLDRRALLRIGVVQPFHWAWTFLGMIVYAIGRAVVVHRRVGRGFGPLWLFIAAYVITAIVSIAAVTSAVSSALSLVS